MPKRYSTKNLEVLKTPEADRAGVGVFEFTDDYSVFHYGKMRDRIPSKGEAIARMAAFNFRLLHERGIPTHFRAFHPPNRIEFTLLATPDPAVEPVTPASRYYMIPLQVVYRNALPPGASVYRRLDDGSTTLEQLGLTGLPGPGEALDPPIVEFTTKREEIDRFITDGEAGSIAGLTEADSSAIKQLVLQVDGVITQHAEEVGLEHADGKVEFGMLERSELILVDNAGTPDENRFLHNGRHVGKQVMRDWYLKQGLERSVQEWAAAGRPRAAWPAPEPLPPGFIDPISQMYRALCEAWTGERVWAAPALEDVLETVELLSTEAVRW